MPEELTGEESKEFEAIVVPDDIYEAEIAGVKDVDLQSFGFGMNWGFDFKITKALSEKGKEAEGKTITGLASAKLTPKTKLWTWATKLGFKPEVGMKLKRDDFVGKKCRILTQTKKKQRQDGSDYYNSTVKEVME